jgi:hypothetical protein
MVERVDIVSLACSLLDTGDVRGAIRLLVEGYPLERVEAAARAYSATEALGVFQRDGFVDRYSGSRLLFPGVLRVLSSQLPTVFPYHPNWKISEIHFAYWELFPAVDPVQPLARGGLDEAANWVTTSMLRKSAKASWTLEELGWSLQPPGDLKEWDGLQSWFVAHVERTPKLLDNRAIRGWYQAAADSRTA